MIEDIRNKYGKYLTQAQIRQLVEAEKRYKQLHAEQRATAAESLRGQYDSARRGLQNMGLAGRNGTITSGAQYAARDAVRASYTGYNRKLKEAEHAQVDQLGARLANETIKKRNVAAKARYEQMLAEQERQRQEYLKQQQERMKRQQLAGQVRDRNQWNETLTDSGSSIQTREQAQGLYSYDPKQHAIKENLEYFKRAGLSQGMSEYEAQKYAWEASADVANRMGDARNALKTGKQTATAEERMNIAANVISDPARRFKSEYGVDINALPTEAKTGVENTYKAIDANLDKWQKAIKIGEQARASKDFSGKSEAIKEADTARREMAKAESTLYRAFIASANPDIADLMLMDDHQFALAYDATVKSYEKAHKESIHAEGQFKSTDAASWYQKSLAASQAEAEAAQQMNRFDQAKVAREMSGERAVKHNQVDAQKQNVTLAHKGEQIGAGMSIADPRNFDELNGTEDSLYASIVNQYAPSMEYNTRAYRYSARGKIDRDDNKFIRTVNDLVEYKTGITNSEKTLAGKYDKMVYTLVSASYMTEDEKNRFNTILKKYGASEADDYFEYLYETVLPARVNQAIDEDYDAMLRRETQYDKNGVRTGAKDGKSTWAAQITSSLLSVPLNLAEGLTSPINTFMTRQQDAATAGVNARRDSSAQEIRNAVQENFGEVGRFFYGAGMSMLDSATVGAISGGLGSAFTKLGMPAKLATRAGSVLGGSLLGGSAVNSAYNEALQMGLTPEKARATALGAGFNEMLFESLSLDLLVSRFKTGNIVVVSEKAWKNWVVNTLIQGGVEGSEEVFTDLANRWWDNQVNGIFSEELTKLRKYMADGMTYEQAKQKVNREFAGQLGMSFLGGAISGGVMGGAAGARYIFQNRYFEKRGAKMGSDVKSEIDNFKFTNKQAQEIQKQSKKTNIDYGMLEAMMYQQMYAEGKAYVQQALKDGTITQEQKELYDKYANLAAENKLIDEMLADEHFMHDMEKLEPVFDIMDEGEMIKNGMRDLAEAQRAVRDENAKYDKQIAAIENDTTLTDEQKRQKLDAIENERGEKVVEKVRDLENVKKKYDVKVDAANGKVETKRGNLNFDFSTSNKAKTFEEMTDRQKSALRFAKLFADKYGMNIKVVDDTVAGERLDGEYNHDTDTITINISGANSVMYTVSHEVTHWLQEHNSKAYKSLKSAIEKELSRTDLIVSELPESYQRVMGDYKTADNTVMDALVKYEQDMYKRYTGKELSRERAEDEVVARCCESFLKDRGFAQKMVASDRGTARTIASKLRQLANDMKTLNEDALERGYEKYGELIDNSIEKAALEQIGDVEMIARMWENALNQAEKKAAKKVRAEAKTEVQHSFNTKISDAQYAALRTGEEAWKNEDIRYSMNDKDFVLKKNNGEKWYELRDAKAKLYGSSVELEGGSLLNRVRMMQNLAEMYGSVTVHAADAKEAQAFEKAGAQRVADPFVQESENDPGTWEFTHTENKYETDTRYDAKQKRNFANAVLKEVGTYRNFKREDLRVMRAKLEKAFAVLHNAWHGDGDQLVAYEYADKLLDQILNRYTEMSEADAEMRDALLAEMPVKRDARGREYREIDVTASQMAEIRNKYTVAEYNAALSKALGTRVSVNQTENARTLEDVFADNPYLEADTNEGDMPMVLLDRAQETVGKRTNPYKAESAERTALKDAMMSTALTIVGIERSSAQKVREAVKQARTEERAKAKTKAEKNKLAAQMERGEFRAKVRREERAKYERKLDKLKEIKYSNDAQVKKDLLTVAKTNYQRLVNMLAKPTEASHVPVQLARQVSEICLALSDLMDADMSKKADSLYDAAKSKRGVINMDKLIDAYKQTFVDKDTIEQATRENPGYDPRGSFIDMSMYDETLVKMMEGVGELLKGKTVKQMDAYELRALMYTLRGVLNTVYDANKATIKGEKRFIYKVAEKMVSELQKAKVFGKKPNAITRFLNQYTIESLGLRRIAKIYSNSDENSEFVKLVDDLNEGAIEVERIALALRKMFDPVTTKYAKDMKTWYGKNAEWIDIGNGVKITKGMRVSLAMHILNEQNLRNLTERGVTIPNQADYKRGDYEQAYTDGTIVKMTKEQAKKIVSEMTEAEKAYFEVAKEFFHKRAGYYINRTSLKMLGYAKAIVENYFPIQVDDAYKMIQYDAKNISKNAAVEHPGFLEARKGTPNYMYLNDITAVVNRQINGVSKYAGLAIPMRNWNAVMNQWMWHEDANKNWVADKGKVHTELEKQMGVAQFGESENGRRAVVSFVDQFVEDLAGASINNANEYVSAATIGQKLTSNYVKAVLTLNARVALSQAASFPTAAAEIPWKYLLQSFMGNVEGHLNRNASNELIDMYTPLFAKRRAGTQTEVSEIMKRKGFADKAEQKLPGLLGWITAFDVATTRRLWYACERWVKGETDIPVGSDAFYQEVARRYERVIQNTQPNFTVLQRAPVLRSKNAFARIISLFGTQPMQNMGVFIESAFEVAQTQRGTQQHKTALRRFGRSVSALITAALVIGLERALTSLARGRVKPMQDDDGKISVESVAKYIGGEFMSSLFGSFMYVGQLYDVVHSVISGLTEGDYGYESTYALPASDAIYTIVNFFDRKGWQYFANMTATDEKGNPKYTDHEKWLKTRTFINDLMTVASYLTGLPFANASKTLLNGIHPGWHDIVDAFKTGEFNPYLHQSGRIDSKKTNANYTEWTNAGKKGSVYLYWENAYKDIESEPSKNLAEMLMRDSSLSAEDKAQLYWMLYGSKTTSKDGIVYTESGNVAVDFTDNNSYLASTELSDAKYEGYQQMVTDGISEDLALVSLRQYAAQKKQGEGANDRFHEWLFKTVSDPHERAVIDMHVIGNTNSVKGDIGYKNGELYRDYSTKAWYDMSAKPKQYKYAKELANSGLTDDKAIALIQQFNNVKKDDSAQYLKGLTEAQKKIIYEYKDWKWK